MSQERHPDKKEMIAALFDEYISAQQSDEAMTPPSAERQEIDEVEKILADELVRLAQTTLPPPTFAANLEAELIALSNRQASEQSKVAGDSYLEDPSFGLPKEWARAGATLTNGLSQLSRHPFLQMFALRPAMGLVGIVALVFMLLFAIPSTQASLRELLYGLTFVDEKQIQEAAVPVAELSSDIQSSLRIELAQILQEAPFVTYLPAWVPPPLTFTNGSIIATENGVQASILYHPEPLKAEKEQSLVNMPHLLLTISYGELDISPILAVSKIQFVMVDHQPAVFVRGNWRTEAGDSSDGLLENLQWDESLDIVWLSWEREGLNYLLYAEGLGLERAEMIAIGDSLVKVD